LENLYRLLALKNVPALWNCTTGELQMQIEGMNLVRSASMTLAMIKAFGLCDRCLEILTGDHNSIS